MERIRTRQRPSKPGRTALNTILGAVGLGLGALGSYKAYQTLTNKRAED